MPATRTLPEALAAAARGEQGYRFVSTRGETWLSYTALHDRSRRVAGALQALGLGRGDLVALIIGDPEQFLPSLFGASMAGVVPASLYPPATTSDLTGYLESTAVVLRSAQARAVITTASLLPHLEALKPACPTLSHVVTFETLDAPEMQDVSLTADDIAFVQYTSGSTSAPKGVIITHRNLSANIDAFSGAGGVGASGSDVAVSWLPLYHDMGLVGMALGSVYTEVPAVLLTPQAFVKRPAEWLRAISRFRGTVSFAPNFAYDLAIRRVKDSELESLDLSSWRVAGCGAEPIHASTLAAFAEKFRAAGFRDTSFLASYGLAEHVLAATFSPRERRLMVERLLVDDMTSRRIATRIANGSGGDETVSVVGCGASLPGHQLRIVDDEDRPLPERHIGEIALAGPSVTPGYYRDAELTARTVRDGWLFTGDLGYLSKGELFVCGRVKDLIIVNGRKYHPQDLEWGLADLAGIRRGRVVAFGTVEAGRPDRTVVVVEPSGTVPARELTDSIRRRIADVCGLLIDDVVLAPGGTVTRTTSGKVRRAATKMQYERGELESTAASPSGVEA